MNPRIEKFITELRKWKVQDDQVASEHPEIKDGYFSAYDEARADSNEGLSNIVESFLAELDERPINPHADVTSLIEEYGDLKDALPSTRRQLLEDKDWTVDAAQALLDLAREYGWFMLRSALALAMVLGIEDGTKDL